MEVKPGYKQTEVGVIPEDWECVGSGVLATYFGGNAFKSEAAVSAGLRWLKIANVGKRRAQWTDVSYLPNSYATDFKEYILRKGDVVMALTRPILNNELKIAKLTELDVPALLNQRVAKVIALPGMNLDFIYHTLQTRHFVDSMNEAMAGTDPPNIGSRALGSIPVATPPTKAEQEAIAEALSDADALIESLEQLLGKKRQLKQGAMQELLTGKKRLPGFSGEWETKRLGDVTDTDPENLGSNTRPSFTFNYIALEDVDMGTLSSYSEQVFRTAPSRARRLLRKDDVLVSTVRPNLVSHLLFAADGDNWVCSTGFCVVRCRKGVSHSGYVYFHMFAACVARQIEALLTGSNYPAINGGDVRALQIPFPEYEEQIAIAHILTDMGAEIAALEAKLTKTRQLKQGMMQELLTGRIRLV